MIFSQVMPAGWAGSTTPVATKAASTTPTLTLAQANQQVVSANSAGTAAQKATVNSVQSPLTVVTPPTPVTPPAPPSQELITSTVNALNRQFTINNMKLKAEYSSVIAHGRHGGVFRARQRGKPGRHAQNVVTMTHPHWHRRREVGK